MHSGPIGLMLKILMKKRMKIKKCESENFSCNCTMNHRGLEKTFQILRVQINCLMNSYLTFFGFSLLLRQNHP